MKLCEQNSTRVSSSCGWNTFVRKSLRKDESVLKTISEPGGIRSRSRLRNKTEGGKSDVMLKTLGSTRSRWPVADPSSCVDVAVEVVDA